MRTFTLFGAVAFFVVGCSGAEPRAADAQDAGTLDRAPGPDEVLPVEASGDAGAVPAPRESINIDGTVIDYVGQPVAGARLLVVDARGTKTEALAGASGAFHVTNVSPPYDLKLSSVGGREGLDRAFLGLMRGNPRVVDYGATVTPPARFKASVSLSVSFPGCPQNCSLQVWTGSANGGYGRSPLSFVSAATSAAVTVEHEWSTPPGAPTGSGNVGLDVLVANQAYTSFWYAHLDTGTLQPNGTLNMGSVTPQPVGTFGPTTIITHDATIPSEWRKDLQVFLFLPGVGAPMYLQRVNASTLVTFLPNIPGATFSVGAWRSLPDVRDPVTGAPLLSRRSNASTDAMPLSAATVPLTIEKGPEPLRPTPSGTLSRGSSGIAWQPAPGRLATISLVDRVENVNIGMITTSGSELRLDRLAGLGMTLREGRHYLSLQTSRAPSLDDTLDPAGPLPNSTAIKAFDWTELGFTFDVTP